MWENSPSHQNRLQHYIQDLSFGEDWVECFCGERTLILTFSLHMREVRAIAKAEKLAAVAAAAAGEGG